MLRCAPHAFLKSTASRLHPELKPLQVAHQWYALKPKETTHVAQF